MTYDKLPELKDYNLKVGNSKDCSFFLVVNNKEKTTVYAYVEAKTFFEIAKLAEDKDSISKLGITLQAKMKTALVRKRILQSFILTSLITLLI